MPVLSRTPSGPSAVEDTPLPPPTSIDVNASQQYCDQTITRAFGKQPQVICAYDVSLFYSMWVQGG